MLWPLYNDYGELPRMARVLFFGTTENPRCLTTLNDNPHQKGPATFWEQFSKDWDNQNQAYEDEVPEIISIRFRSGGSGTGPGKPTN